MEIELINLETSVRNSKSDDPLSYCQQALSRWYSSNLFKNPDNERLALQKCLDVCVSFKKYANDVRLFEIVGKLADIHSNPELLYQSMFSQKMFLKLSHFYLNWGCRCEIMGKLKMACDIYKLGMEEAQDSKSTLSSHYSRLHGLLSRADEQHSKGLRDCENLLIQKERYSKVHTCEDTCKSVDYPLFNIPLDSIKHRIGTLRFVPESPKPGMKYTFSIDQLYPQFEVSPEELRAVKYFEKKGVKHNLCLKNTDSYAVEPPDSDKKYHIQLDEIYPRYEFSFEELRAELHKKRMTGKFCMNRSTKNLLHNEDHHNIAEKGLQSKTQCISSTQPCYDGQSCLSNTHVKLQDCHSGNAKQLLVDNEEVNDENIPPNGVKAEKTSRPIMGPLQPSVGDIVVEKGPQSKEQFINSNHSCYHGQSCLSNTHVKLQNCHSGSAKQSLVDDEVNDENIPPNGVKAEKTSRPIMGPLQLSVGDIVVEKGLQSKEQSINSNHSCYHGQSCLSNTHVKLQNCHSGSAKQLLVDNEEVNDENIPPDGVKAEKPSRLIMGPLQPSIGIVIGEPEEIEEYEDPENDMDDIDDQDDTLPEITRGITNAFKNLISSTLCRNEPIADDEWLECDSGNTNDISRKSEPGESQSQISSVRDVLGELPKHLVIPTRHKKLSLIEEMSDESRDSKSHGFSQNSNEYRVSRIEGETRSKSNRSSVSLFIDNVATHTDKLMSEMDVHCIPFSLKFLNRLSDMLEPIIMKSPCMLDCRQQTVPRSSGIQITLEGETYFIKHTIEGGYGRIYQVINSRNEAVCIKIQRPPFPWEFYVVSALKERLKECGWLPDILKFHVYRDASVIIQKLYPHGTLLDLVNSFRLNNPRAALPESLVFFLARQLISAVLVMHRCQIIHGDLKPDNLMMNLNESDESFWFTIIDFGHSIDMRLYPRGTTFTSVVDTPDFIIPEMRDGQPWSYQIDYYGIAAITFIMLFGRYMKIQKRDGLWVVEGLKRYWQKQFWDSFFKSLLNCPISNEGMLEQLLQELDKVTETSGMFGDLPKRLKELRQSVENFR